MSKFISGQINSVKVVGAEGCNLGQYINIIEERSGNPFEGNIPSLPSLACGISVGLPMMESSNLLIPELSTRRVLHESRDTIRLRRQPPPRSDGLERDSKLACHVASSSRREEMTAPMHWFIGGSLPPNSLISSEDGPVLVFHLLSFVCHMCWYSFAELDMNVAVSGSRISCFEAKAAIPQLFAQ
jgi:hypothetical protein